MTNSKFQTPLTLNSHKSGLKNHRIKNYHIFGTSRTSAFIWHPLIPLENFCIGVICKNAKKYSCQMLSMVFFKLTCLFHNFFFPKSGNIFIFLLLFVIWSMNRRWLRDIGCSQRFEHHESWQGQIFLGVVLCKRRSQKSKDKRQKTKDKRQKTKDKRQEKKKKANKK